MMVKVACAALLALASSGPGLAITVPSPYGASFETVPQIMCVAGDGAMSSGSGIRLNDNTILTAAHVPSGKRCMVGGVRLDNTRFEPGQDIAFVTGSLGGGLRAVISCEGVVEGRRYLALGYADGGAPDVETLTGTDQKNGQLTIMIGHVYHGMSGGAVLNERGAVVAVINAMQSEGRPMSFVTPLTQTYLCKGNAA